MIMNSLDRIYDIYYKNAITINRTASLNYLNEGATREGVKFTSNKNVTEHDKLPGKNHDDSGRFTYNSYPTEPVGKTDFGNTRTEVLSTFKLCFLYLIIVLNGSHRT